MAQATREFVLVHGAGHGAWCWDAVARRLEARGHRVVALDLPGHGRRAAEAGRASVATYASAVADAMAREGVSRGVVVGHSMAGVVIPKAAELVPARVAHLVFLAAVVLPHGTCMMNVHMPPTSRPLMRGLAAGGDGRSVLDPASMAWPRWMGALEPGSPEARLGVTPIDLDTDHDAMLSAPDALARILDGI